MVDVSDSVTADLRAEAGDALRVVATYDPDGYDLVYCRDDVTERTADRAPAIHDDLVLQGVGREHLESLFEAGDLHCSVHRFDDLTAFHFLASEYTGLFVSVDNDADVRLASFADACREHVDK
ncbi:hypothetical protein [Halobacterium jilantaiense]|uniref:Uncharacterized protein n=1 Tax=Halobacterium jilantaiense TaxID=355548 RepID=A0A1I0NU27_9EURY|nr:hypothetical protein [Halobacterium jilantaiense]SEW05185.1 hypothetical protein SAMN04487945_1151 [Halobacterium jilantaiense]